LAEILDGGADCPEDLFTAGALAAPLQRLGHRHPFGTVAAANNYWR
jgi:hypothetical protein